MFNLWVKLTGISKRQSHYASMHTYMTPYIILYRYTYMQIQSL